MAAGPVARRKPIKPAPASNPGPDQAIEYGILPGLIGFHLRFAALAVFRDFTAHLSHLGITQHQHGVMEIIALNPGATPAVIADALGTDRPTLAEIIDKLEERKLVQRRQSLVDGRRRELFLSDAGKALLDRANALIEEHEARIVAGMKRSEIDRLLALLRRLHGRTF